MGIWLGLFLFGVAGKRVFGLILIFFDKGLRGTEFISCRATRNEPKKRTKEDDLRSPLWTPHPIVSARGPPYGGLALRARTVAETRCAGCAAGMPRPLCWLGNARSTTSLPRVIPTAGTDAHGKRGRLIENEPPSKSLPTSLVSVQSKKLPKSSRQTGTKSNFKPPPVKHP